MVKSEKRYDYRLEKKCDQKGTINMKIIVTLSFHVYDSIFVHDIIFLRHGGMPVSFIGGSHTLEYESIETDIQTRIKKDDVDEHTVVDMKTENY